MAEGAAPRADTSALLPQITHAVGANLLEAVSEQDMDEIAILPAGLLRAVEVLRRDGFDLLLDIGATDHHPLTPRFEISYHFLKVRQATRYRLRVFPDDLNPVIPTLTALWPNADWAEREVWDLFGVRFDGHPNLVRILMPDDWKGHPLRKDYPLRGLERRFQPRRREGRSPPGNPQMGATDFSFFKNNPDMGVAPGDERDTLVLS